MSILDRLSARLGELIDDVRLPERVSRTLDEAERSLAAGDADAALARIADVDRERPGVWRAEVVAGLAHEARGELDAAARRLDAAARIRDDTVVLVALGRVATSLGDLRTARDQLERVLERRLDETSRLEILLALATLNERIGPRSRAVPVLRQASRLRPLDGGLALRFAAALESESDHDGAIAALDPLLDVDPPALDVFIEAARLLRSRAEEGDAGAAESLYGRVLERSADNPDALEGLAAIYARQSRVADALPLFQQALLTAPIGTHGRLHRQVGECYRASGQHVRALDAFRAAVALDPADISAHTAVAALALTAGDAREAADAAEAALALDASSRRARALLGRALIGLGQVDEARPLLSSLRAARMDVEVLHAIGELALRTDDAIEAIALLGEAAVRQPDRAGVQELLKEAYRSLSPRLPPLDADNADDPAALAPFLDALSEAVASHPLLTDLIPRATALRQHLDTPLTIAVLGEFNAGKSTLINAFVAEDMVVTGVLPTTSHVNVVRYGPRKVARWTRLDGSVSEIPYDEAARLVKEAPESIEELEFCFPHPDLRSVHFWDTPGFNAPDTTHEARARAALETADAVVWMLDANQALSWTEFERLAEIPSRSEKLLVVLNKVDRIGDDDDARAAIEEHVGRHLESRHGGIFWLSALRALESRRPGATAPAEPSGWEAFEDALRRQVFERAGHLKALEVVKGLLGLLAEAMDRTEGRRAAVRSAIGSVGDRRQALLAQAARWPDEVSTEVCTTLNRALQDVRSRAAAAVGQLASPGAGLFGRRTLAPDDRGLVLSRLLDRAETAHAEAAANILDRADRVDRDLVALVETTATTFGPPDSRTLRRRLEAYLAETTALRGLLFERMTGAPCAVSRAFAREFGDRVVDALAAEGLKTETERVALLHRLVPSAGEEIGRHVDEWGAEYLAASARLCDHVERDLDILALDLEHRIMRPFSGVRRSLASDPAPEAEAHES